MQAYKSTASATACAHPIIVQQALPTASSIIHLPQAQLGHRTPRLPHIYSLVPSCCTDSMSWLQAILCTSTCVGTHCKYVDSWKALAKAAMLHKQPPWRVTLGSMLEVILDCLLCQCIPEVCSQLLAEVG